MAYLLRTAVNSIFVSPMAKRIICAHTAKSFVFPISHLVDSLIQDSPCLFSCEIGAQRIIFLLPPKGDFVWRETLT